MTAPFKAAAVQFEPVMFEKERNVAGLLALVEQAAEAGAKLIATPEMGTTGYCWHDRAEVAPFVEPVPGPTTDRFAELARRHDCFIVIGMPEVDLNTNLYYNAAVLIGPDGVVGVHRKTHPYISEPKWAASGDLGHQVFDTRIGRIALLICMDIHFIETARLVALGGADVICHISNWLAERTPAPYWINRAFENGCYLIESNRWGLERGVQFSGGSCVIAPDASILDVIDRGDGIAYAAIEPEIARAHRVFGEAVMEQRRPELYMDLLTNTFTWNPLDFFRLYGHAPIPEGRAARISVAQFGPTDRVEDNLGEITTLAERAKSAGAELVVFPELALTGLAGGNGLNRESEPVSRMVDLAAQLDLHIVVGFAEKNGSTTFNSALLAGPDGLLGIYRKTHLAEAERSWATAGDEWLICNLPFARVGMLIGHDATFPEAGRILALRGCDLILCPAAIRGRFHLPHEGTQVTQPAPIPTGADSLHWHQYRVRAGENNCYLAFANVRAPLDGFAGLSGIFGPDTFHFPRQESVTSDNESLATMEIDTGNLASSYPTNVVRRKDLVLMRQPHHYYGLLS